MAGGINARVEKAHELADALGDGFRQDAADAVEDAVALIRDRVRPHVPVQRGVLRASVKGYVYRERLAGMVAAGGRGARHANLVELGVKKHSLARGAGRSRKRPKNTPMLIEGNPRIIRRGAQAAGFAGVHFMRRGYEESVPRVNVLLRQAGVSATARWARFERRRGRRTR